MMKKIRLSLSEEEKELMMSVGLSQKEAQMRLELRNDKTYEPQNFLSAIFNTKDPYRREGYVHGAVSYYSQGYLDGRRATNCLNPIDKSTLANTINSLLGTIGVSLSYHTSFGGLFMNRPYKSVGETKFIQYEMKGNSVAAKEMILDEEMIKILNAAQNKIENLIQNLNK